MENTKEILIELVKNYCVGEIEDDTDLYERGLNSLNSIEFLVDIEDQFGLSFEAEELRIQNLKTLKDFQRYIEEKQETSNDDKD
jgi:acyl carrier protein